MKKLIYSFLAVFLFLLGITSVTLAQTTGDYQSVATGDWTTLTTWERWDGDSWETPTGINPEGYPGEFTGTGDVTINAHTVSIGTSGITTQPMGKLTIISGGQLILTGANNSEVNFSLNTLFVDIQSGGSISFIPKVRLTLAANAVLSVGTGGLVTGTCNANIKIFIGPVQYASCNGGNGGEFSFAELMNGGGTINAIASSNSPVCPLGTISLTGDYSGAIGTTPTYSWVVTDPNNEVTNYPTQNVSIPTADNGTYSAVLTVSTVNATTTYTNSETIFVLVSNLIQTWTGETNNDWNTASNWNPEYIPQTCSDVTIPGSGITNFPTIAAAAVCNNITIESGASLLGNNLLTIGGTAKVERDVIASRWNMVTPSTTDVTGQTFFEADPQDSWLARFDESVGTGNAIGAGWIYMPVLTDNVNVGQGYTYYPSVNETVEFAGTLQAADLNLTLSYSGTGYGYNAIGNCFTSALQWNANADWALINVEGTIWIWNGTGYSAYTQASGHNIAVGQGFFVKATADVPSITLPSSQRNHNASTFLKNTENGIGEYENALIIKAQNNQAEDKVQISFGENGTEGFDNGWDGTKLFGNEDTPQLYLVEQGIQQSYDHLPSLVEEQDRTVAMSYIPGVDGSQTLIADFSYFTNANVSLEDLKTGTTQNLRDNNVYTFTGSKADIPERFLLHFAYSPNGIGNVNENASNINIYAYGDDIYIRSNNSNIQQGTVYVYDLLGREIAQQVIGDSELVKLSVDIHNAYAVVKVVKDGFVKTEKVFVK